VSPPSVAVPLHLSEPMPVPAQPLKRGDPCTAVILGAGGDLTRRKLMPALYHLLHDGLLHDDFSVVGAAREALTDQAFRDRMRQAIADSEEVGHVPDATWDRFAQRIHYVQGDMTDPAFFAAVSRRVAEFERASAQPRGRLFYLALPPSVYATAVEHLSATGLAPKMDDPAQRPWARVIIEKPFGTSLATARALNQVVLKRLAEHQVFRIDHYLGKETVQNLLVLRFANSIFEPIWNRQHIDHVQITASETVGVEHRAGYYEQAGVVRDMFQNHLLQLLALTAMEPPVAFRAEEVRDEKAKVLRAVRPIPPDAIGDFGVRGQYGPGAIDGTAVPGYRQEDRVAPASSTPTYAAVRFLVDNWRWQGVPFYVRSGKRLARRATEIAIQFRRPPHLMFAADHERAFAANVLAIRIQPNEGISLCFEIKVPGVEVRMTSVQMDFSYAGVFGHTDHSAYETLLLDAMVGDGTLYARSDQVEAAWALVDPIVAAWEARLPEGFPNYASGSWGPAAADELIARDGARWREPQDTPNPESHTP
jgi:glucose-6-phosphate 1-dehydrogenase